MKKEQKKKKVVSQETEEISESKSNNKKTKNVNQKSLFDFGIKGGETIEKSSKSFQPILKTGLMEIPENEKITIYSWNVAGLRAVLKKDDWKKFITKEKPDILCLNESKVDDEIIKNNKFENLLGENYHAYFYNSSTKKGYSGVTIFTRYQPKSVKYGIGIEKHDEEGRVITMEFENFYLVATYIPNAGEGLKRLDYRVKEWDIDFQNYLESLKLLGKGVIWAGDTNVAHKEIDIHNPKGNLKSAGFTVEERNSFSTFLDMGWVDTYRIRNKTTVCYSYWSYFGNSRTANRGWRLDYFVVDERSDNEIVLDSEILTNVMGSDHCPVKLTITNKKLTGELVIKPRVVKNIDETDIEKNESKSKNNSKVKVNENDSDSDN